MKNDRTAYAVVVSAAKMPLSCWGRYKHVAVIEYIEADGPPLYISDRPKRVVRIVCEWRRQYDGATSRSAAGRAIATACKLAAALTVADSLALAFGAS